MIFVIGEEICLPAYLRHVWKVHLDGVLVLVYALAHVLEERAPQQLRAHHFVHLCSY